MPGSITTRHLADGNSPNSLSKLHWLDKHSSESGPKFYWYTIVNDSDIKLELSPSTKPTTCSSVWLGENNFVSSVLTNTRGDSYPVIPLPCMHQYLSRLSMQFIALYMLQYNHSCAQLSKHLLLVRYMYSKVLTAIHHVFWPISAHLPKEWRPRPAVSCRESLRPAALLDSPCPSSPVGGGQTEVNGATLNLQPRSQTHSKYKSTFHVASQVSLGVCVCVCVCANTEKKLGYGVYYLELQALWHDLEQLRYRLLF